MPTYINLQNLIIPKDIIRAKFRGGMLAFRQWFEGNGSGSQEDQETFSIARMNSCEADIQMLVQNGLTWDEERRRSDDFCWIARYGGAFWEVDWLEYNAVYAWHKECKEEKVKRAKQIAEMNIDEIGAAFDRGENPWETIW